jgi:outer membrane protein
MILKSLIVGVLGLAFNFSALAAGYGVVDIQKVILSVDEGKAARAGLEKEIKAKEKEFITQKKELDKMNKEWTSQAALMSDDAKREKQMEFQEKFMALRNQEMKFQQELKQREAKVTQQIAVKVARMVNDMAKTRAVDIVFEANSSGLIYVKNPVDLTGDVIKLYDKKLKNVSKK